MSGIYTNYPYYSAYFEHHGIKGQRWGIRRYRPYPKGEKPVGAKEIGEAAKKSNNEDIVRRANREEVLANYESLSTKELEEAKKRITLLKDIDNAGYDFKHRNRKHTTDTLKAIGGVAIAGMALYGTSGKTIETGKEIISKTFNTGKRMTNSIKNLNTQVINNIKNIQV